MGGMGTNMCAPGKSGITFDHILSRLQGELQKSRETSAMLHSLTGVMNEIHKTFGCNLVSTTPSIPMFCPLTGLFLSCPHCLTIGLFLP